VFDYVQTLAVGPVSIASVQSRDVQVEAEDKGGTGTDNRFVFSSGQKSRDEHSKGHLRAIAPRRNTVFSA
jgi:hypothetical protein